MVNGDNLTNATLLGSGTRNSLIAINNGVLDDICDLSNGAEDCDANGQPDTCQQDTDSDGVIDPCDDDLDGDGHSQRM